MELATRRSRFYAKILDQLPLMMVGVVSAVIIPLFKEQPAVLNLFVAAAVLFTVGFLGAQCWLLTTQGKTVGKRAMGIRIVKVADGSNGGFVTNVLLRIVPLAVGSMIPVIGTLVALANPLFIFREDQRCLHDHVAGTVVVQDEPVPV
jgi:uncharacterized RDD family membrane protein YckC